MNRISTSAAYQAGIDNMLERQRRLADAQERLTSGKRVQRASDDPTAAARAERALAGIARSDAEQRTLEASRNAMTLSESALSDAGELMQQAREMLVATGNTTYSDSERRDLAQALRNIRNQLLGVANRGDGAGGYLFGGQGASSPPFVETPTGVQYRGAGGQLNGASTEPLPLTVDGQPAWLQLSSGNGFFDRGPVTGADGKPSSVAWVGSGSVTDPSAYYAATSVAAGSAPPSYEVQFTDVGGDGTLDVQVLKDGNPVTLPNGQTSIDWASAKGAVEFDGMRLPVGGAPKAGDKVAVTMPQNNGNVFKTLDQAIEGLLTAGAPNAKVMQTVQDGLAGMDVAMGALQSLRSRVGQALERVDGTEARNSAQKFFAQSEKSAAEDLDMVQAVSDFSEQQNGYEAALRTYSMVQRLSMFDYINP